MPKTGSCLFSREFAKAKAGWDEARNAVFDSDAGLIDRDEASRRIKAGMSKAAAALGIKTRRVAHRRRR